jgi:hypothetical protein
MESMVEKYLYQDCAELFALDACNLGLDMTTEEEELKSVIGKLPEEGRNMPRNTSIFHLPSSSSSSSSSSS